MVEHAPTRNPSGLSQAASMTLKQVIAAAFVLGLGPVLASCASSPGTGQAAGAPAPGGYSESAFSAYVADHWPHWAGGMPADVPPRPGAPGYEAFIAHGQGNGAAPDAGAAATGAATTDTAAGAPPPDASISRSRATGRAAPAPAQAGPDDPSAVHGGLY